jgi:hypothetical protein
VFGDLWDFAQFYAHCDPISFFGKVFDMIGGTIDMIDMKKISLLNISSFKVGNTLFFLIINNNSIMKMIRNLSTKIESFIAVISIKIYMAALFAWEKIILVYNKNDQNHQNNNISARLKFRDKISLKDILCLILCSILIVRSYVGFTWETN